MGAMSRDAYLAGTDDVAGMMFCERCGHKGIPLLFDTPDEVVRYREQRAEDGWEREETSNLSLFPASEVEPRSRLGPGLLLAIGAASLLASLVFFVWWLVEPRNTGLTAGLYPAAVGLSLVAIGLRQWRHRGVATTASTI